MTDMMGGGDMIPLGELCLHHPFLIF